jgi:hypothetical protein
MPHRPIRSPIQPRRAAVLLVLLLSACTANPTRRYCAGALVPINNAPYVPTATPGK